MQCKQGHEVRSRPLLILWMWIDIIQKSCLVHAVLHVYPSISTMLHKEFSDVVSQVASIPFVSLKIQQDWLRHGYSPSDTAANLADFVEAVIVNCPFTPLHQGHDSHPKLLCICYHQITERFVRLLLRAFCRFCMLRLPTSLSKIIIPV